LGDQITTIWNFNAMRRFRFSLRGLLLAITCVGILLCVVLRWWTEPYALTGTHSNGIRAWEQWERRTPTLKIVHIRTLHFYRNGQKGYEYEYVNGKPQCWSPEGQRITEREYATYFLEDGLEGITDDQTEPPYKAFLWWWNGW
jgi:hypothetical protein